MQRAVELIEELKNSRLKHLAGMHDQHTHAPSSRANYAGKSVNVLKFKELWNDLVVRRGIFAPVLSDDAEVWDDVAEGIKREKLRATGGFGLCAYDSLSNREANPKLKVAVGVVIYPEHIKHLKEFDTDKYWSMAGGDLFTTHVWNVDENGKVVDSAFGSKEAKGNIYVGEIVPDSVVNEMITNGGAKARDGDLLNLAHDFVQKRAPHGYSQEDWDKWSTAHKY